MYALLALNACLALYALVRLLTDPRAATQALGRQFVDFGRAWRATHCRPSLRDIETDLTWLAYVLFTVMTLLTHNTAVFFPIAANLFILGLFTVRRVLSLFSLCPLVSLSLHLPSLRNWLLAQAGVLLLWSLWLPAFISQSLGVYREFWLPAPTLETVAGTVGAFVGGLLPLPLPAVYTFGALCTALVLLGLCHFRRKPARVAFLLVVFVTPILGEWLVSLWRPIFYERTLIWASFPLCVLLAVGIRKLRLWPLMLVAVLLLLALNGLSLHAYYIQFDKEQWDDAAALVAERVEPGDLILFNATWMQIPFDYYFHRLNETSVVEHGVPVDMFDRGVLEPQMTQSDLMHLRELVGDHDRVWLVYSHNWYTDPQGVIPPALERALDLHRCWEFYGVRVWLYTASSD